MKLTILKIILWPKDLQLGPRVIPFVPGKINIITGESGSGKSTLTWIIDYCLGSEKCSIPVGLIRDVTGWFGLHLQLANTEMIVARRNPGDQQTTSDLYWVEGLSLVVPDSVQKNARVEDLKNRFNQITHLPALDFSIEDRVGFGGRASFRDMAAFNFQPQHIVANPFTFFYKADTTEHREKLQVIFPLALGSIDASTLGKQRELKDTEREHDKLSRELNARLNAARAWEAEVESYYLQARTLGLLPDSAPPQASWRLDKYVLELQKVPETVKAMDLPDIQEGTSEAAVVELTQLISEEDRLAQEIGSIRRRLSKIDQLSTSVGEYGNTLTGQEDRIKGVGWFEEKLGDTHHCPVCAAVHTNGNPRLAELKTLASDLKLLTAAVYQAPPKLDQELAVLKQELRDLEGAISKVRQKRKFLEDQSNALAAQRQRVRQVYLFVGRVEQALENVSASSNVDDLRQRMNTLAQRITELRQDLDPRAQARRLDAAIDTVSATIANYAGLLQLEHATENVRLNIRELTLQFSPLSGRTDFLWEVGSGQNWVGYHIAGLLALHEHFINLTHNVVPRFLIIDQPSQVYFPEAWPSIEHAPKGQTEIGGSADIDGVRRIFNAISHFLDEVGGEFQVIVTEHAGSITWDGISNVHLVGNWRRGHDEFLIPSDWLQPKEES
jgi:energy-coupling factor transporter ATP-binding protein EcfA2